jgi:tetratricopeptide (TPR) repeat protein
LSSTSTTIGGRYILQQKLGAGGMGAVFRATDRLTQQTVALKQVTIPAEQLQFASRGTIGQGDSLHLALTREFRTLASLRHPHIISVLDYGFDEQQQPFLTMELLENAPNLIEAGRDQTRPQQIALLVQILQALAYLHQRGIIHRDLKPDNVLVIGGQVKVLDFGLAVAHKHRADQDQAIYGTPAYMAPEVFDGQPVSEASDLYAVGVMAFELFAGRHPFNTTNFATLTMDLLQRVPDTSTLGLDEQQQQILDRLLVKNPTTRFSDAREVINIYAEASNQPDLVIETQAIRESFLQAAHFVGREAEFGQLVEALTTARMGQGSAWLIGGESGVGKSRLLDEFRIQALVDGALVLLGQAISEGARPFRIWQAVLRRLCLEGDLSDQEAGVLKALVSDIGRLLDREVSDAPPLAPQAAYERLLKVVVDVVQRQTKLLLVILEDLQWVGDESLALLARLNEQLSQSSVLLLASYRDDERPRLPEELPRMQCLKLPRLTADNIAALSEAMLGPAGRQPELIDLLQQETEGNAFFIVEVVRALIEEVGQLDQLGQMSLPHSVFAGGMQTMIERRLQSVLPQAYPLLQVAAVTGRQIDANLLRHIDPKANIVGWLASCAEARVLEVQEGRWRFVHDKLREGLLVKLPAAEQKVLHQQVAEAIEQVYGPDLSPLYPRLAYHWRQVVRDGKAASHLVSKAVDYLQKAGDASAGAYANAEAITFFRQALDLFKQIDEAGANKKLSHLYLRLGRVLEMNSQFDEALATYEAMEQLAYQHADQSLMLATLMAQMTLYITPTPLHEPERGQALGEQTLALARYLGDEAAEAKALWNLALGCMWSGRTIEGIDYGEKAVALARRLNLTEQLAFALNDLGMLYTTVAHIEQAKAALHEAGSLWRELGNLPMLTDSLSMVCIAHVIGGEFDQAIVCSGKALQISQSSNNLWGQSHSQMMVCWAYWERGQPDRVIATATESIRLSKLSGYIVPQVMAGGILAAVYAGLGALELGLQTARLAVTAAETQVPHFRCYPLGVLAQLHLLGGNLTEAGVIIEQGKKDRYRDAHPAFNMNFNVAEAEVALKQGDYERVMSVTGHWLPKLHQSGLRLYTPAMLHIQSQAQLASGQDEAAREGLEEAQAVAEAIGSRRMLWQILFSLSQLEPDPDRAAQLRRQAGQIVEHIAGQIDQTDLRESFLNLPNARAVFKSIKNKWDTD